LRKIIIHLNIKKMDSLITIKKTSQDKAVKAKLLSNFRTKFADAELSRNIGNNQKAVITEDNHLHVRGYQIFRGDLIRLVAAISDDIILEPTRHLIGNGMTLKKLLDKIIGDSVLQGESHPIRKEIMEPHERSVWVDFGYGLSAPRTVNNRTIMNQNELQLVFTAVTDGKHPADDEVGEFACATTARTNMEDLESTDPPFSTPVHPMD
jgi:hypothetical protein